MPGIEIIISCWLAASVISDRQTNVKNIHDAESSVNSGIALGDNCKIEHAAGRAISATKMLAPFSALALDGAFEVEVRRANQSRLMLNAAPKIIEAVGINVVNKTLSVSLKHDCNLDSKIKLVIESPELEKITVSGAGDIIMRDIAGTILEIAAEHAAGNLTVFGKVKTLKLKVNGAATIDVGSLIAENADVDVAGAATATVNVQNNLTVKVAGAATVRYCGTPKTLNKKISGAASLENIK